MVAVLVLLVVSLLLGWLAVLALSGGCSIFLGLPHILAAMIETAIGVAIAILGTGALFGPTAIATALLL
jgi:hypothetical protein